MAEGCKESIATWCHQFESLIQLTETCGLKGRNQTKNGNGKIDRSAGDMK